ncbi:hypothetical protein AB0I84_12185 [Streptomyces spectabilis]|uniref:hypothetical protein n=1 Tax=Streptomyces spectabilis TaxID=68270 RepID=UPI0033F47AB1
MERLVIDGLVAIRLVDGLRAFQLGAVGAGAAGLALGGLGADNGDSFSDTSA